MNNNGSLALAPVIETKQTTAKFLITASIDGFPVMVEVEGKADALRGMIDRLKAIGATPPGAKPELTPDASATVCEFHGPMKASTAKPGSFFCPKKMGDGSYCKSKG